MLAHQRLERRMIHARLSHCFLKRVRLVVVDWRRELVPLVNRPIVATKFGRHSVQIQLGASLAVGGTAGRPHFCGEAFQSRMRLVLAGGGCFSELAVILQTRPSFHAIGLCLNLRQHHLALSSGLLVALVEWAITRWAQHSLAALGGVGMVVVFNSL
jgi:hypothetical protein